MLFARLACFLPLAVATANPKAQDMEAKRQIFSKVLSQSIGAYSKAGMVPVSPWVITDSCPCSPATGLNDLPIKSDVLATAQNWWCVSWRIKSYVEQCASAVRTSQFSDKEQWNYYRPLCEQASQLHMETSWHRRKHTLLRGFGITVLWIWICLYRL